MSEPIKTDTEKLWKEIEECRAMYVQLVKKGKDPQKIKKQLQNSFEYLATFERIFDMVTTLAGGEENLQRLRMMLNKTKEIQDNKISQYNASGQVGTMLAEQYIYPRIDMSKEKGIDYKP